MSRQTFNVKDVAIGTGDNDEYTFDFKIEDETHLLIIVQDDDGVETERVRGDDTTFLDSVDFDPVAGGGTVTLVDDLPTDYTMTMLLANDEPTQPSEFRGKASFTLSEFEAALDYLGGQIQRAFYLVLRSVRLNDLDDVDDFDPTLPVGAADNPGATIAVNDDGDGLAYGATLDEIAEAEGFATAALASEVAAAASAAAAAVSAAAAAASAGSGFLAYGTRAAPLDITAAGGITSHGTQTELQFVHGSPGVVTISANPQITAGTQVGQILTLMGTDDTNTLTLSNGNGLVMNGDCTLLNDSVIGFVWDGTNWCELYRR